MFARNNKVKQITEVVQFGLKQPISERYGVSSSLPLIAFPNPEKGWTISSKLGEISGVLCHLKKVYKSVYTICEETVKLGFSPR